MPNPNRRQVLSTSLNLTLGTLGLRGVVRPGLRWSRSKAPSSAARGLIHIVLGGGLSHLDSFDPKPEAPLEVRGEFRTVPTTLAGVRFAEPLARTAEHAHRLVIVRSLTHREGAHERAAHLVLTGNPPLPALSYPSLGAMIAEGLPRTGTTPPYFVLGRSNEPALLSGYLPPTHAPFRIDGDPNRGDFRVADLLPPPGVDPARRSRRHRLARELGSESPADPLEDTLSDLRALAQALGEDPLLSRAVDLSQEPPAARDRFGKTPLGQRCLLARRLIEANARCVTIYEGGFDHHANLFRELRPRLETVDRALSALIQDLETRGLLSEVVVLVTSEFGRTPEVNRDAGRDHWPRAFSAVLAGFGLSAGRTYGSTDASGGEPAECATSPADLAATTLHLLGLDPFARIQSPGGRPIDRVRDGRVLREILA